MKQLSIYLFLILFSYQTQSWAEDIRDFQIEGMSIGDSLLDYFSEEEIKKDILRYDHDNEFVASYIRKHSSKTYDSFTVAYKPKDKNYIIYSIEASIGYRHNINECYQRKDEIVLELSKLFNREAETYKDDYDGDKSGKSKVSVSEFYLKSGGAGRVICYDIDEELSKNKGWWDRLSVIINSKEFVNFLTL